ncbi:MAG: hypothetical protein LBG06_09835 [Deltaproteobacteria bacterium]|jgi:diacylglycerol kinase family enzyme|nr:hypothetical protein [Deltaproteobacteria bacterium]
MRHFFVINPVSFKRREEIDRLAAGVCRSFPGPAGDLSFHVSRFPRDAVAVIRRFAEGLGEGEAVRVYAVGGDGILFDCLNGVVGLPGAELASVPYGRANDFVRAFGDGVAPRFRDVGELAAGEPLPCDVIYAGNNYALNTCTIGLESYAVWKAAELHRQYRGLLDALPGPLSGTLYSLLYFIGGMLSINNGTLVSQRYQVTVDGQDLSGNYAIINIANGPCYGGDKSPAVSAVPDDGLLDVLLFRSTGIFTVISKGFDYLYGRLHKYPDLISYRRAREVSVRSDLPLMLQLDGEVFIDTNINVRVIPAAVKIISVGGLRFKERVPFTPQ